MKNRERVYSSRLRFALLVVMFFIVLCATTMIVTAFFMLIDLRSDVRLMNEQIYEYQQEIIKVRSANGYK